MLKLRSYEREDAEKIVTWCKDELTFRKWSADLFEHYPISAEDLNNHYKDAIKSQPYGFKPVAVYDESGVVGQLIIRALDKSRKTVRFGFVIVDQDKRGKGYGKEMLSLALEYTFQDLKAEKVTLGVFANNPSAYYCYKSVGFKKVETDDYYEIMGERWRCIEMEYGR